MATKEIGEDLLSPPIIFIYLNDIKMSSMNLPYITFCDTKDRLLHRRT